MALFNSRRARKAERKHPAIGRFMMVDGVRLHFIERGQGEPIVLFHGNGSMIEEFMASGLVERLSARYRVIVFDRPGYGHSARPRRLWTPTAQARLFRRALERLGIEQAVVLGHSWGTLVAVALALDFPSQVRGLVLAGGYFYPTARADVLFASVPAIPVIGDGIRYTLGPLVARLIYPRLIRKIFSPAPVPERFVRQFPKELALRPWQLRAAAEDSALMIPAAAELRHRYGELEVPLVIVAGTGDRIVDTGRQSRRLHGELPRSEFIALPGIGHMVHHLAPDQMVRAVDRAAQRSEGRRSAPQTTTGAPA